MSRFAFPGKYAMRVQKGTGKVRAYFNFVDTESGIEFRDARLIEGKEGMFVAAPFRTYKDKDGKDQFADFWRPAYNEKEGARDERGVAYMEELCAAAVAKYEELSGGGSSSSDEDAPRAAKKSGRGPVAGTPKAPANDDDDDDLPFGA